MLRILQVRLQKYLNQDPQMFKLDLGKAEEPEIKLPTSVGSLKKQENPRKNKQTNIYFCFIDYAKVFVWITNCGKFLKMGIPDHFTCLPLICMQVKKQQLEPDMEQQTGSKLGKENVKAVYCHPAYLIYMQSTSCEMPGWIKHKLVSRLSGEISII